MEWKIGEIFEYNGKWYQCLESNICRCDYCDYGELGDCNKIACASGERSDDKEVHFKKLDKVGEPYVADSKCCQQYQCYTTPLHNRDIIYTFSDNRVVLEIKNKEDMKEKKIKLTKEEYDYIRNQIKIIILPGNTAADVDSDKLANEIMDMFSIDTEHSNSEKIGKNLRPFDLEAAKLGKPVCTRDGRKARIICFDRKLFYRKVSCPILALVERSDGEDDVCGYNEKGKVLIEDGAEYKDDLMMLPEKRSGWVNVYKERVYGTKEEAIKAKYDGATYVDTVNISWEE